MSVSEFVSADPTLVQTIRRHVDGLKRTDSGAGLLRLLERGLSQCAATQTGIDLAGVTYLHAQLGIFASDDDNLPALRVKARVIQQHLVPYLGADAGAAPERNPFQRYIDVINGIGNPPPPLAPVAYARIDEPPQQQAHSAVCQESDQESADACSGVTAADAGAGEDACMDAGLEGVLTRDEQAETRESRYQALRKSELDAWRAIYGTIKDFKSLKRLWIGSLDELLRERMQLEQQLSRASDHIKSVESDRDRLQAELSQSRSQAAKLPRQAAAARAGARRGKRPGGLPKREVFLQQLEAEVERARRHGGSLALALIGIDGMDELCARYGKDAEKCAFNCYTGQILANFRTYDFVGIFDAGQFAVLFPGTDRDGALRALVKVQKRASETHLCLAGTSFALPGFYSALSLHAAGEDAESLLARARSALDQARTAPPPRVTIAAQRLALVRPEAQADSRSRDQIS